MEKLDIHPEQEIVITAGDLIDLIDGLAIISKDMLVIQDEIKEEESRQLLVKIMALFVAIARLFPREQKKQIFELLKTEMGVDLTNLV